MTRKYATVIVNGGTKDSEQRQVETLEEIRRNNSKCVVVVLVPTSFLRWPPRVPTMAKTLGDQLRQRYHVVAFVKVDREGRTAWVDDPQSCAEWNSRPIWYDRQEGLAMLVLWRRND